MKKLIAGLGLTFAVVVPAHAHGWSGEDMLTMEANQAGPIVHVKSVHISGNGWHGGRYHTNPASYQCQGGVCQGGWRILETSATARVQVRNHASACGCAHPAAQLAPRNAPHAAPRASGWQRAAAMPHAVRVNAQPATARVQRVTSERIYVQRVTRTPPRPTCPLAY
jgi:hypothetical protein